MKVFISHKQEDSFTANQIANELKSCNVAYYLDVLDESMTQNGKELTDHTVATEIVSIIVQTLLLLCHQLHDYHSGCHLRLEWQHR